MLEQPRGALKAERDGYSLHAATYIAAGRRADLEHFLRYMARPPLCQGRLMLREDGQVIWNLRKPWRDGTRHMIAIITDPLTIRRFLLHLKLPPDPLSSDPTDLDTPLECGGEWHTEIPIPMGRSVYFSMPSGIEFVNAALIREFPTTHERRYPVLLMATDIRWHHELTLPAGYALDMLPAGRSRTTEAGLFESSYQVTSEGRIVIERRLRIERDRYAPAEYDGLRAILLEGMIDIETIMAASLSG